MMAVEVVEELHSHSTRRGEDSLERGCIGLVQEIRGKISVDEGVPMLLFAILKGKTISIL